MAAGCACSDTYLVRADSKTNAWSSPPNANLRNEHSLKDASPYVCGQRLLHPGRPPGAVPIGGVEAVLGSRPPYCQTSSQVSRERDLNARRTRRLRGSSKIAGDKAPLRSKVGQRGIASPQAQQPEQDHTARGIAVIEHAKGFPRLVSSPGLRFPFRARGARWRNKRKDRRPIPVVWQTYNSPGPSQPEQPGNVFAGTGHAQRYVWPDEDCSQ
jgi:hypothetical protein